MKKQYISPLTLVVAVTESCAILAGSVTETLKTTEVSDGDTDFTQYSRGYTLWDNEEEEEY